MCVKSFVRGFKGCSCEFSWNLFILSECIFDVIVGFVELF